MSNTLSERIARQIEDAGGWLPFERFMAEALYAPALGYYETGEVFGADGDFVTGTELGPWLALGFADLIEWGWRRLGSPAEWSLVEQGGGEGRLLCDVLRLLDERGMSPPEVHAVERSGQLRTRQQLAYAAEGRNVHMHAEVSGLPEGDNVIYFCNELPDAFPVDCFVWRDRVMRRRGVGLGADGGFVWKQADAMPADAAPDIDARLTAHWPEGYISEWNPALADWQAGVSRMMNRGFAFCVDYGYAQSEYYRPQRVEGTLLAHLRHEPVHDVLSDPGSRDITAHIDFTALSRAGHAAGLSTDCWMPQGAWLAQSPGVQARIRAVTAEAASVMATARRMLMPQGMGELFKLAVQSKGVEPGVPDFLPSFNRLQALETFHG